MVTSKYDNEYDPNLCIYTILYQHKVSYVIDCTRVKPMPRELICSVTSDHVQSGKLASEIAELKSLLKCKGGVELQCTEPEQYVCFDRFEVSGLACIDASVFDLVQTWWARRYPHAPCCIVRASGHTKLDVYCPVTHGVDLCAHDSSPTAHVVSRLLLLLVLSFLIYDGFYCKYRAWAVHSTMQLVDSLQSMT